MTIPHVLAELYGWCFIIICLSWLSQSRQRKAFFAMVGDGRVLMLIGIINVIFGVGTLLAWHSLAWHWTLVLTLLGIFVLSRGLAVFFFPDSLARLFARLERTPALFTAALWALVCLGVFLVYAGMFW